MSKIIKVTEKIRCAERDETSIVLNIDNGACIELDTQSKDILDYIKNNEHTLDDIVEYVKTKGVNKDSFKEYYDCLKELGFIYENR